MITVTKSDLIKLGYGPSFSADIIREAKKLSKRQILMRSDTKLPQPFASWSNSL